MRAIMFVICAIISALATARYVITSDSAGWGLSPNGVTYTTPSHGALVVAIVFGILALGLVIEPYLSDKKPKFEK